MSLKFHAYKPTGATPSKVTSFGLTSLCKHTFEVGKGEKMMLVVSYLMIEHGNEKISFLLR